MTRMICIGAQSVDTTELTVPPQTVEMLCRRNGGDTQRHCFFVSSSTTEAATPSPQLPLFEVPQETVFCD